MYYISFQNLIQEYVVPSSITCVNSMEVSYIPIAKARGFTTHWIKNFYLANKLQLLFLSTLYFVIFYKIILLIHFLNIISSFLFYSVLSYPQAYSYR